MIIPGCIHLTIPRHQQLQTSRLLDALAAPDPQDRPHLTVGKHTYLLDGMGSTNDGMTLDFTLLMKETPA